MKLRLRRHSHSALSRMRGAAIIATLILLVSGFGMLLFVSRAPLQLAAESPGPIESIQIGLQLKPGHSADWGPIWASPFSWLNLDVISDKTITLQIISDSSELIFNATGRVFRGTVSLAAPAAYRLNATNPENTVASVSGHATLSTLVPATVSINDTTRPLKWQAVAFLAIGTVGLIWLYLPKKPHRRNPIQDSVQSSRDAEPSGKAFEPI